MAKREEKVTESTTKNRFKIYANGFSASKNWATWCTSKKR